MSRKCLPCVNGGYIAFGLDHYLGFFMDHFTIGQESPILEMHTHGFRPNADRFDIIRKMKELCGDRSVSIYTSRIAMDLDPVCESKD